MTAPSTPAFPSIEGPGMTLRDYAAIQIAAGIVSRERYVKGMATFGEVAQASVSMADLVLHELSKPQADAMIAALKETGDA